MKGRTDNAPCGLLSSAVRKGGDLDPKLAPNAPDSVQHGAELGNPHGEPRLRKSDDAQQKCKAGQKQDHLTKAGAQYIDHAVA